MIRIVLVEWGDGSWRLFRQPQWMAQVRDTPEAATWTRLHFDIAEEVYATLLAEWGRAAPSSREAAEALLADGGAIEVRRG